MIPIREEFKTKAIELRRALNLSRGAFENAYGLKRGTMADWEAWAAANPVGPPIEPVLPPEMIDRVAKAICRHVHSADVWHTLSEFGQAHWRGYAIAVIEAMVEPTAEMTIAPHWCVPGSRAAEDWRANINAALGRTP